MKNKTFWFGFIAVYIVAVVIGFLVHGLWLGDTYMSLLEVWRPQESMMSLMWVSYVTSLIYLWLFCYIFTKGHEGKGVMEGVRYGFLIGLLMSIPMAFDNYVIYPIPFSLAIKWFVSGLITWIILGAVFALIYKPANNS